MLSLGGNHRVFLCQSAVDFRKAHDGLCAVIRDQFQDDPFAGDVFAFQSQVGAGSELGVKDPEDGPEGEHRHLGSGELSG